MDFGFYKSGENLQIKLKITKKIEDNKIVALEKTFLFYKQHKKFYNTNFTNNHKSK